MAIPKGNRDGKNRRNKTYQLGAKKKVARKTVVKKIESGEKLGAHVYKRKNKKYVRDNRDKTKKDNVNRK